MSAHNPQPFPQCPCLENYMCFHTANAWEEGPSTIRLFLCAFKEFRWGQCGAAHGGAMLHLPFQDVRRSRMQPRREELA